MLSIKEALQMPGTPFIMVFSAGDTMEAYVKKFDPKDGLSCWSLGLVTSDGYLFEPNGKDEEAEGAVCLIGVDVKGKPEDLEWALEALEEIKTTGRWQAPMASFYDGEFQGCPL